MTTLNLDDPVEAEIATAVLLYRITKRELRDLQEEQQQAQEV